MILLHLGLYGNTVWLPVSTLLGIKQALCIIHWSVDSQWGLWRLTPPCRTAWLGKKILHWFLFLQYLYVLDVNFAGVYQELIFVHGANITLEWYAHRVLLPLLVFEVSVQKTSVTSYPLHINLAVNQWRTSRDLDFSYASTWSHNNIRWLHLYILYTSNYPNLA